MGCDIHVRLEIKRTINGEKKWVTADYFSKNPLYEEGDEFGREYEVVSIYSDRNYSLFSLLAGVRNYGDNVPISEPKGVPDDCSEDVLKDYEQWECDAHSASYFTLKELMDFYGENKKQKMRGMISPQQQYELDVLGKVPSSWCQGTNMIGYEFREWKNDSDLKYFIEPIIKRAKKELWIYNDENNTKVYDRSDLVRVVFWFDN